MPPKSLLILVRKPPYGSFQANEAARIATGLTVSEKEGMFEGLGLYGHGTTIILYDDGVYVAVKGQQPGHIGWPEEGLDRLYEKMIKEDEVRICVLQDSLIIRGLQLADLIDGVQAVDFKQMARLIISSDVVFTL